MTSIFWIVSGFIAADAWKVPWYLDCSHSSEWTAFRERLETVPPEQFDIELFWWAHTLLEKTEPIFLRVQNSKHFYHLCDPVASEELMPTHVEGEESVFSADGGTDQWTNEERDRRSMLVRDFCYYGYIAALGYRTRLVDASVPGVLEGRETAMSILWALLMSRSNSMDLLDSAGWPLSHTAVAHHLHAPGGLRVPAVPAEITLDELDRLPAEHVASMWIPHVQGPLRRQSGRRCIVAAVGYHTSLVLELTSLWSEFLGDRFPLEVAAHILEPGTGDAAEIRKQSLCRDFHDGAFCAWDSRVLMLNSRHVHRSHLHLSQVPNPEISDPALFVEDFSRLFGRDRQDRGTGHPKHDSRLDMADLYLCTEPAFMCGVFGSVFPDKPLIGYLANPLTSYIPLWYASIWLQDFARLAGHSVVDRSPVRSAQFVVMASTRFLAEQIRYQSSVPALTMRPIASYLGPPRMPRQIGEVIVLRTTSIFWNSACVLNSLLRMNIDELATVYAKDGENGIHVSSLFFRASEELADAASENFAAFEAAVVSPYDVSQMRLYELYALAVPIILPSRVSLPSYIYRGMTTLDDFNHSLLSALHVSGIPALRLTSDPFERNNWSSVAAWSQLTHWNTLPHLIHCAGAAELLLHLVSRDLRLTSVAMRRRQQRDLVRATRFWATAFPLFGFS